MVIEGILTQEQMAKYKSGGEPEAIENLVTNTPVENKPNVCPDSLNGIFAEDEELEDRE